LIGVVSLASSAHAVAPNLGSISPRGAQRNTEAVVLFSGARLGDADEILYYYPGITTTKIEVVNDNQIKATLKIAPDCRLGEHAMRVRTKGGVSELRTFYVGALPIVDEKEPNSDFAAPQKINLNVTVHGVVDSEDVDYYLVECKKGQRLSVEVEGMRLGTTVFDPYVAILDMKRFELAASDDTALLKQDPCCSIVVPADGTYVVQIRESAYGGNGACQYRLHIGTFPRPLAVVPSGGKPGEEIEVRFLGDPSGEIKQKIKLPATADAKFGIHAEDAGGISPSALPFRLFEAGNVIEVEPNDNPDQATKAELPLAFNGVIDKPGDVDYFKFAAKKGQTYDVHCYARRIGSLLDPIMYLSIVGGGDLVGNDDAIGPDSYFRFTAPDDKEYVLRVYDHLKKGGPTYSYRIEFTPVAVTSTTSIPKVNIFSQERQTISVPNGNRMAVLMSAGRGNWGGDATFNADALPPGVTLVADTLPASMDVFPVVIEAAPTANVSGVMTSFRAMPLDPKIIIKPEYRHVCELSTGGPGQSVYWSHTVNKTAVAVTEEAPFKISIVEPKAPMVQGGSMNLKIIVERKPEFKDAITITPLWNPPGVGSASSATIAAGTNEITLPMNAAPNAAIRKWKTAVLGMATVKGGPLWVSSQLATIEVAAPFFTFTMDRPASEQGKPTELFCKVAQTTPFEGAAKVKLIGLPLKVTAPDIDITKDTKEFVFKLDVDKTSPAGQHRNLFCQAVVMVNGEPVVHNVGTSELRIDVPLPPKPNQPPPMGTTTPPPPPMGQPEKRLTRLEKLRLEQQEREKQGTTPPMPEKK